MRTPQFQKQIAVFLAVILMVQISVAASAESQFWESRRQTINNKQLASLPSSLLPRLTPQTLTDSLPALERGLERGQVLSQQDPRIFQPASSSIQKLIQSIPLTHANIHNVYEAKNSKKDPVVLVQDVHLNNEAQLNIAAVLQSLIDQKQISMVGVEGAFNQFDFSPYRQYPNKDITRAVIQDMLNQNLLAAPSYVGITSAAEPPVFLGVDDPTSYRANVDALYASREIKEAVTKDFESLKDALEDAKETFYSDHLKKLDSFQSAYHHGQLEFGTYVQKLASHQDSVEWAIQQFLEATHLESSLDFSKVERERRSVLEKLTERVSETEMKHLLANSLAYRMGRMNFGDYYHSLQKQCEKNGIPLNQTPHFNQYIQYVLLSDGINADTLFKAVSKLEEDVFQTLAKTPEEKLLVTQNRRRILIEKLLSFSLTPLEWEKYQETKIESEKLLDLFSTFDFRNLSSFERFYSEADIRSHKMVANLLSEKSTGAKALVLGGFHAPQISHLLKVQNISHVIVSPKLTKVESASGSSYLSVFDREKNPLDRLMAGEKLFVYPAHLAFGTVAPATRQTELIGKRVLKIENEAHPLFSENTSFTKKIIHQTDKYRFEHGTKKSDAKGIRVLHTTVQKPALVGYLVLTNIFGFKPTLNMKILGFVLLVPEVMGIRWIVLHTGFYQGIIAAVLFALLHVYLIHSQVKKQLKSDPSYLKELGTQFKNTFLIFIFYLILPIWMAAPIHAMFDARVLFRKDKPKPKTSDDEKIDKEELIKSVAKTLDWGWGAHSEELRMSSYSGAQTRYQWENVYSVITDILFGSQGDSYLQEALSTFGDLDSLPLTEIEKQIKNIQFKKEKDGIKLIILFSHWLIRSNNVYFLEPDESESLEPYESRRKQINHTISAFISGALTRKELNSKLGPLFAAEFHDKKAWSVIHKPFMNLLTKEQLRFQRIIAEENPSAEKNKKPERFGNYFDSVSRGKDKKANLISFLYLFGVSDLARFIVSPALWFLIGTFIGGITLGVVFMTVFGFFIGYVYPVLEANLETLSRRHGQPLPYAPFPYGNEKLRPDSSWQEIHQAVHETIAKINVSHLPLVKMAVYEKTLSSLPNTDNLKNALREIQFRWARENPTLKKDQLAIISDEMQRWEIPLSNPGAQLLMDLLRLSARPPPSAGISFNELLSINFHSMEKYFARGSDNALIEEVKKSEKNRSNREFFLLLIPAFIWTFTQKGIALLFKIIFHLFRGLLNITIELLFMIPIVLSKIFRLHDTSHRLAGLKNKIKSLFGFAVRLPKLKPQLSRSATIPYLLDEGFSADRRKQELLAYIRSMNIEGMEPMLMYFEDNVQFKFSPIYDPDWYPWMYRRLFTFLKSDLVSMSPSRFEFDLQSQTMGLSSKMPLFINALVLLKLGPMAFQHHVLLGEKKNIHLENQEFSQMRVQMVKALFKDLLQNGSDYFKKDRHEFIKNLFLLIFIVFHVFWGRVYSFQKKPGVMTTKRPFFGARSIVRARESFVIATYLLLASWLLPKTNQPKYSGGKLIKSQRAIHLWALLKVVAMELGIMLTYLTFFFSFFGVLVLNLDLSFVENWISILFEFFRSIPLIGNYIGHVISFFTDGYMLLKEAFNKFLLWIFRIDLTELQEIFSAIWTSLMPVREFISESLIPFFYMAVFPTMLFVSGMVFGYFVNRAKLGKRLNLNRERLVLSVIYVPLKLLYILVRIPVKFLSVIGLLDANEFSEMSGKISFRVYQFFRFLIKKSDWFIKIGFRLAWIGINVLGGIFFIGIIGVLIYPAFNIEIVFRLLHHMAIPLPPIVYLYLSIIFVGFTYAAFYSLREKIHVFFLKNNDASYKKSFFTMAAFIFMLTVLMPVSLRSFYISNPLRWEYIDKNKENNLVYLWDTFGYNLKYYGTDYFSPAFSDSNDNGEEQKMQEIVAQTKKGFFAELRRGLFGTDYQGLVGIVDPSTGKPDWDFSEENLIKFSDKRTYFDKSEAIERIMDQWLRENGQEISNAIKLKHPAIYKNANFYSDLFNRYDGPYGLASYLSPEDFVSIADQMMEVLSDPISSRHYREDYAQQYRAMSIISNFIYGQRSVNEDAYRPGDEKDILMGYIEDIPAYLGSNREFIPEFMRNLGGLTIYLSNLLPQHYQVSLSVMDRVEMWEIENLDSSLVNKAQSLKESILLMKPGLEILRRADSGESDNLNFLFEFLRRHSTISNGRLMLAILLRHGDSLPVEQKEWLTNNKALQEYMRQFIENGTPELKKDTEKVLKREIGRIEMELMARGVEEKENPFVDYVGEPGTSELSYKRLELLTVLLESNDSSTQAIRENFLSYPVVTLSPGNLDPKSTPIGKFILWALKKQEYQAVNELLGKQTNELNKISWIPLVVDYILNSENALPSVDSFFLVIGNQSISTYRLDPSNGFTSAFGLSESFEDKVRFLTGLFLDDPNSLDESSAMNLYTMITGWQTLFEGGPPTFEFKFLSAILYSSVLERWVEYAGRTSDFEQVSNYSEAMNQIVIEMKKIGKWKTTKGGDLDSTDLDHILKVYNGISDEENIVFQLGVNQNYSWDIIEKAIVSPEPIEQKSDSIDLAPTQKNFSLLAHIISVFLSTLTFGFLMLPVILAMILGGDVSTGEIVLAIIGLSGGLFWGILTGVSGVLGFLLVFAFGNKPDDPNVDGAAQQEINNFENRSGAQIQPTTQLKWWQLATADYNSKQIQLAQWLTQKSDNKFLNSLRMLLLRMVLDHEGQRLHSSALVRPAFFIYLTKPFRILKILVTPIKDREIIQSTSRENSKIPEENVTSTDLTPYMKNWIADVFLVPFSWRETKWTLPSVFSTALRPLFVNEHRFGLNKDVALARAMGISNATPEFIQALRLQGMDRIAIGTWLGIFGSVVSSILLTLSASLEIHSFVAYPILSAAILAFPVLGHYAPHIIHNWLFPYARLNMDESPTHDFQETPFVEFSEGKYIVDDVLLRIISFVHEKYDVILDMFPDDSANNPASKEEFSNAYFDFLQENVPYLKNLKVNGGFFAGGVDSPTFNFLIELTYQAFGGKLENPGQFVPLYRGNTISISNRILSSQNKLRKTLTHENHHSLYNQLESQKRAVMEKIFEKFLERGRQIPSSRIQGFQFKSDTVTDALLELGTSFYDPLTAEEFWITLITPGGEREDIYQFELIVKFFFDTIASDISDNEKLKDVLALTIEILNLNNMLAEFETESDLVALRNLGLLPSEVDSANQKLSDQDSDLKSGTENKKTNVAFSNDLEIKNNQLHEAWIETSADNIEMTLVAQDVMRLTDEVGFISKFPNEYLEKIRNKNYFGRSGEEFSEEHKHRMGMLFLNLVVKNHKRDHRVHVANMILLILMSRQKGHDEIVSLTNINDISSIIVGQINKEDNNRANYVRTLFLRSKDEERLFNEFMELVAVLRENQIPTHLVRTPLSELNLPVQIVLLPEFENQLPDEFIDDPLNYIDSTGTEIPSLSEKSVNIIGFYLPSTSGMAYVRTSEADAAKVTQFSLPNGKTYYAKRVDPFRSAYPEEEIDYAILLNSALQKVDKRFHAVRYVGYFYEEGSFFLISEATPEPVAGEVPNEADLLKIENVLAETGLEQPRDQKRRKDILFRNGHYYVLDMENMPYRFSQEDYGIEFNPGYHENDEPGDILRPDYLEQQLRELISDHKTDIKSKTKEALKSSGSAGMVAPWKNWSLTNPEIHPVLAPLLVGLFEGVIGNLLAVVIYWVGMPNAPNGLIDAAQAFFFQPQTWLAMLTNPAFLLSFILIAITISYLAHLFLGSMNVLGQTTTIKTDGWTNTAKAALLPSLIAATGFIPWLGILIHPLINRIQKLQSQLSLRQFLSKYWKFRLSALPGDNLIPGKSGWRGKLFNRKLNGLIKLARQYDPDFNFPYKGLEESRDGIELIRQLYWAINAQILIPNNLFIDFNDEGESFAAKIEPVKKEIIDGEEVFILKNQRIFKGKTEVAAYHGAGPYIFYNEQKIYSYFLTIRDVLGDQSVKDSDQPALFSQFTMAEKAGSISYANLLEAILNEERAHFQDTSSLDKNGIQYGSRQFRQHGINPFIRPSSPLAKLLEINNDPLRFRPEALIELRGRLQAFHVSSDILLFFIFRLLNYKQEKDQAGNSVEYLANKTFLILLLLKIRNVNESDLPGAIEKLLQSPPQVSDLLDEIDKGGKDLNKLIKEVSAQIDEENFYLTKEDRSQSIKDYSYDLMNTTFNGENARGVVPSDHQSPHDPSSIFDPVIRPLGKYTIGKPIYWLWTVLGASITETFVFHNKGFHLVTQFFVDHGVGLSLSSGLGIVVIGVLFGAAHIIVRWIVRGKKHGWKRIFSPALILYDIQSNTILTLLSMLWTTPFLLLDPASASAFTILAHALHNAAVLALRRSKDKTWRQVGRRIPLGSLLFSSGDPSEKIERIVRRIVSIEDSKERFNYFENQFKNLDLRERAKLIETLGWVGDWEEVQGLVIQIFLKENLTLNSILFETLTEEPFSQAKTGLSLIFGYLSEGENKAVTVALIDPDNKMSEYLMDQLTLANYENWEQRQKFKSNKDWNDYFSASQVSEAKLNIFAVYPDSFDTFFEFEKFKMGVNSQIAGLLISQTTDSSEKYAGLIRLTREIAVRSYDKANIKIEDLLKSKIPDYFRIGVLKYAIEIEEMFLTVLAIDERNPDAITHAAKAAEYQKKLEKLKKKKAQFLEESDENDSDDHSSINPYSRFLWIFALSLWLPIASAVASLSVESTKSSIRNDSEHVAKTMVELVANEDISRAEFVDAIMELAPAEKVFSEDSGNKKKISAWNDVSNSLRDQLSELAVNGNFESGEDRARLADLTFILRQVLTDQEYQGFVGSLNEIPVATNSGDSRGFVTWVNNIEQLQGFVSELNPTDRAVISINKEDEKFVEAISTAYGLAGAEMKAKGRAFILGGRVDIVLASMEVNAASLVRLGKSSTLFAEGEKANLLILDKSGLPDHFFNLTDMDRRYLQFQAIVYFVNQTMQAIEIHPKHLADWESFRSHLIHA